VLRSGTATSPAQPGRLARLLGCTAIGVFAYTACAVDAGHPPVARIEATPRVILEHDGFQTLVSLDGTASADPIDDPDGVEPLSYEWTIRGDEVRFESGDRTSPAPQVRFRGDAPATVELTVTDAEGSSNTASLQMQLTISE
jgi:hypothetical protein